MVALINHMSRCTLACMSNPHPHRLRNLKNKSELEAELAAETFARRTVSFYRYVQLPDPQTLRNHLYVEFERLGCKGRIYLASEGINAQMNVPEHNWTAFDELIQSLPEFSGIPYKMAVEEAGTSSFLKLTVKVRPKIVADGLDDRSFDPSNTGKYMTAAEVNAAIEDPEFTLIDMRNGYEAEVGRFEGARTMKVDTFREQLARVEDEMQDAKQKKVVLYCTGGIRCEKASAWMKHKGFADVYHIKGGIIDYAHQVKEQGLPNKFHGKNFVFDERRGERISDEIIATCHLCQTTKSDEHHNCRNMVCNQMFIACPECLDRLEGYCGADCLAASS